jgi:hypothetical protein
MKISFYKGTKNVVTTQTTELNRQMLMTSLISYGEMEMAGVCSPDDVYEW